MRKLVLLVLGLIALVVSIVGDAVLDGKAGATVTIIGGLSAAALVLAALFTSTRETHDQMQARAVELVNNPETQGPVVTAGVEQLAAELRMAGVDATVTEGANATGERTVTLTYPAKDPS